MKKTIGILAVLALGFGLSLQALAQAPSAALAAAGTKSGCEQNADAQHFRSHSDRHWFVLRCMTEAQQP